MPTDYEFFRNKRDDRLYLSRSVEPGPPPADFADHVEKIDRPFRFLSKVVDSEEGHTFIEDGDEIVLRVTEGGRQEIKAKFYEDDREIITLQIQKYTRKSGKPHKSSFTFRGDEIRLLYHFIRNVALLPIESEEGSRLEDGEVESLTLSRAQALKVLAKDKALLTELLEHNTSAADVALLGRRKGQLDQFERLLNDEDYFETARASLGKNVGEEAVWQRFFELNAWIFGYGLSLVINQPLEGRKLEQVVKGYDFSSDGKRVDGLLKTAGLVSSLAFCEIKRHSTLLLNKTPYRPSVWRPSSELSGGIAQLQKTVQASVENLETFIRTTDSEGELTGEELYLYNPKAVLVIGSLSEFVGEHGVNKEKYASFELYRRGLSDVEIITFDELFERARFIVSVEE